MIITQLISELCFPKSYFNDCYVFLFNWTSGAPLCVCKGGVCNPESSSISMEEFINSHFLLCGLKNVDIAEEPFNPEL